MTDYCWFMLPALDSRLYTAAIEQWHRIACDMQFFADRICPQFAYWQ